MSMVVRWKSVVVVAATAAVFFACQTQRTEFAGPPAPLVPDAGDEAAPPPPACAGLRCSRDLHQVLDGCTNAVVKECAPDLGCSQGACVAACDSAANAQGSIGCSFWTMPPDVPLNNETSCYTAFIANTWGTPASVTAELGNAPLDISKSIYRAVTKDTGITYELIDGPIPPGELGIVFLSQGDPTPFTPNHVSCPSGVKVAYTGIIPKEHTTSIYKAFHLATSVPVSAYSMFPYGGAKSYIPSATLLLPTPSWGTNYLLIDGWQRNAGKGDPFVQIVAQEDNTEVRLRPRTDIHQGVGVTGALQNTVATYTLNRGQVLELKQAESLAGSPIESNHPIALFGGNQCTYIPDGVQACDSLQQQIAPIHEWSSSYSAVPYKTRLPSLQGAPPAAEGVYWRIAAASDGTILTYAPAPPGGAPDKLESGQIVSFTADHPFAVKSQDVNHPIYLAVHMSGSQENQTLGDPDFVNVIPDDQFLDHYVFFVDHSFADSNVTVVRRKDDGGFHDVTIDCLGPVTGWEPLGADGSAEYAWVDMTRSYVPVTTPLGRCNYGRHEANSDGAFALYVWGIDKDASYGFPAGAGSRPTSPYQLVVH